MSFLGRHPEAADHGWQHDAWEQLGNACGELDAAARQARSAARVARAEAVRRSRFAARLARWAHLDRFARKDPEGDNELAILGEEVIDLATRGLVIRLRVAATARPKSKSSADQTDKAKVIALALGAAKADLWPASAVARLQVALAPLTRAIEILAPSAKESADDRTLLREEATVLREEVMDVATRLAAARSRVYSEKDTQAKGNPLDSRRSPAR